MLFKEIVTDESYWTMRGNIPIKMKIISKNEGMKRFPNIWMLDEIAKTVHTRYSEQIFKEYNNLRDYVFPKNQ